MPLDWQLNTTVIALQGRNVSATPPADGQVLTWDNTALAWGPANTSIPDGVFEYKGIVSNPAALPTSGQMIGDTYYSTADSTNYYWNGTAWVPMGLGEAPADGQIYGRDGETNSWDAVLPLSGGTLTGPLLLEGPPTPGGDPNQAVTLGFVQGLVTAGAQFLGPIDASLGEVFYTPQSGFTAGPLVAATTVPGTFVVASNAGTIPPGIPASGISLAVGDWLYSNGAQWVPINLGYAPLNNPIFSGTPLAPNPNTGNSSQQIATTSWVNAAIALYVANWAATNNVLTNVTTTGDVESC